MIFACILYKQLTEQEMEYLEAARQFNQYVVSHFIKQIYPEQDDPLLGNSNAKKIFKDLLLDEYAKNIADKNDLGIGKIINRQIASLQKDGQSPLPNMAMKKYEAQLDEVLS